MALKFNREIYKGIKKMDRREMEKFLENMYMNAFQDGKEAGMGKDQTDKFTEVIKSVKGCGPVMQEKLIEKWNRLG